MSFNGAGVFNINSTGNPVVTGTVISSTWANALTADLGTGLSTTICRDGQSTITANIPMGGFKLTGLGVGSSAADSVRYDQVILGANLGDSLTLSAVAGSNTITGTGPTSYTLASRQPIYWIQATTNTGATTLNITPSGGVALTAKAVFVGGVACVGGELVAGNVYGAIYDGTQYQVISNGYSSGTFTATLTGCTTSPTYTVTYTVNGKQVTLDVPTTTATSNATGKTLTGMPANIRPTSTAKNGIVSASDNGGSFAFGLADVLTSGVIDIFSTASGGNWTTSGTFSSKQFTMQYVLGT